MVIKNTPQILKRISIRWLPDPAYEDTETIALNVGGYFMDLRVTNADGTLQWSRAGVRKTLKENPLTFQWTRIIDSTGGTQPDEAVFHELPNGDDLETGTFIKDGTPTEYEEIWRDVTEKNAEDGCAWIIQRTDGLAFVGKVGTIFMGMQQGDDGSFGVRKEVYKRSTGTWETTFEGGASGGIPKSTEISLIESQLRSQDLSKLVGEKVQVEGREYVIRGVNE